MAIIRSKIARQLLAEGGAPRVPFRSGGRTDANTMSGSGYTSDANPSSTGFEGSPEMLGQGTATTTTYGGPVGDGGDDPPFVDTFRANQLKKQIDIILGNNKPSLSFIANILKGPQREVYNKDIIGPDLDQYGISGKNLTRAKNIQEEIDNYEKTGRLSQPDFEKAFFGPGGKPPRGEGGDNEPIRKLKAPITEKIEEPKDEFDDILKFYGARFARGGRTDAESQYGADSYGSYSFEDDGNRGGDGPPAGPPKVTGGGEPEYVSAGIGKGKGLTPQEISILNADIFNEYYGTPSRQEEVLGPLGRTDANTMSGSGIGAGVFGAGPSVTFGQEVTKGPEITGATVTQPTGFTVDNIADTIFDKGSLAGKARDALRSNKSNVQSLRDRFDIPEKADGGAIRQNYGLGSIVKKIGRTVKKVAKSPIGKAALFAGLGAYGLGAGPFGASGAFANAKGAGFLKSKFMKDLLLKKGKDEFTFGNLSPLSLIGIPTVASYLMAKKEENEDETLPEVNNTDPAFQKYLAFYGGPRRFAEGGGDIDEAPMESMPRQEMASKPSSFAELNMLSLDLFGRPYDQLNDSEQEILMEYFSKSKDMPERTMAAGGGMMNPNDEMLNLGGNEMDLRGGGFVPLGEYEKKDDVPARLSKNEFVFTADAVRAAGGGSVDRGADLMYKTMKQLENKVV